MFQINQLKLNFLAEQQKQQPQASLSLGDKDTSTTMTDAAHNSEKTAMDNSMSVGISLTVIADSNSKSSQHNMEKLPTSESRAREVDASIRTLDAVFSSPDSTHSTESRHSVSLSDSDSQS
jgi:hypothetical protein